MDVGAWIRVSSGGQDEANQEPDIERYCAGRDYHIARRYQVHGKSAYHGQQQAALDEALADMRAGVIKRLVIWHSDRIERREGKALLDVLAEFTAAGGSVESVQEPALGQLDFGGQVTTFIAGLINHEKSAHLAEQVRIAHDRIRENEALVGRPPFGYEVTGTKYGKTMVPTPEGQKYVPEIFARVIAGKSLDSIARWLDAEGVQGNSKGFKGWYPRTVGTLIRNATYMGHRQDAAGKTVLRVDPIVDADVFRRANAALDSKPKRGLILTANRALLSGVLRCGKCGGPMSRIYVGPKAHRGAYYRCTGTGPARKPCRNMIAVSVLDAVMDHAMAGLDRPVLEYRVIPGHDYAAQLADLRYEMQQLSLRDLSWDDEDAERARLRAEYDRLAALPVVPEQVQLVDTSETYAGRWAGLTGQQRGDWLRSKGVRMDARRNPMPDAPPLSPVPDPDGRVVRLESPELIVNIRLAGVSARGAAA